MTHTHLCKYVFITFQSGFVQFCDLWCCVFGLLSHRSMMSSILVARSVAFFSTGLFFFFALLHLALLLCPSIL